MEGEYVYATLVGALLEACQSLNSSPTSTVWSMLSHRLFVVVGGRLHLRVYLRRFGSFYEFLSKANPTTALDRVPRPNLHFQVAHKKFSAVASIIVERLPPEQLTTVRTKTRGEPSPSIANKARPAVSTGQRTGLGLQAVSRT